VSGASNERTLAFHFISTPDDKTKNVENKTNSPRRAAASTSALHPFPPKKHYTLVKDTRTLVARPAAAAIDYMIVIHRKHASEDQKTSPPPPKQFFITLLATARPPGM
jgi:hypothetical protein